MTLPTTAAERKAIPIATGFLDYFPLAVAAVAELSRIGNDQHNPGEPLHWSRGKSDDHADCGMRHFMERGKIDVDKVLHTTKAAWRIMALLQLELEAAVNVTAPETKFGFTVGETVNIHDFAVGNGPGKVRGFSGNHVLVDWEFGRPYGVHKPRHLRHGE